MDWYTFLIIIHLIGTVLGVGGATFAEIFYFKAKKDGVIEPLEVDYLRTAYFVLRIGLFILIISGFGFLLFYRLIGAGEVLLNQKLWAKLGIVVILVFNAFLIQAKKIPMWLGASVSLTSWYGALVLGAWRTLDASFTSIIIVYIIAVFIMAGILEIVRRLLKIPKY
ncbi:MAG: hypothetical protein AAB366_02345 [Patescibacteria group bacterium]